MLLALDIFQWRFLVSDINWRDEFRITWSTSQRTDGLLPWLLEKALFQEFFMIYADCAWWTGKVLGSWLVTVLGSLWKRSESLVCHEQAVSPCSVWRKSRQGILNVITDVPVKNQAWFLVNKMRWYIPADREDISIPCRIRFNYLRRQTL